MKSSCVTCPQPGPSATLLGTPGKAPARRGDEQDSTAWPGVWAATTGCYPWGLLLPGRKTPPGEEAGESGLVFACCLPVAECQGMIPLCLKQSLGDSQPLPVFSVTSPGMLPPVPPASLAAVVVLLCHC